ncbi:DUF3467 domain-containing protein [Clostridium beijerinckii]|uniref:DUF3467 domain-containing protein n=1 Tax=Clostridium beijerinckii TaxID=1520 RepID=A0A9Q5CNJ4_CLOBE|nr:DUF3467 domain-containing protein [Clostridium beijerinckii]AQS04181.1 hypothetical protein CLBIJ_16000 [Clostridium beijerinckii]MBA2883928.1 hypothetical protein [Clostridium beijerinckii]MBA2899113.1 hypothetical protein [Clostridium beijerinckii]MBA2908513.1 hypothetical protein [Clostridium beijerinckii]MBA9016267.1 hypothetical protein [Clostridium beijerinckii]
MDNETNKNIKNFYYCNLASIETSNYDFRFNFGRIKESGATAIDAKKVEEYMDVEIVMSPQHAKALLQNLSQNLAMYEDTFGTINVIPKSGVQIK